MASQSCDGRNRQDQQQWVRRDDLDSVPEDKRRAINCVGHEFTSSLAEAVTSRQGRASGPISFLFFSLLPLTDDPPPDGE